jgi:prepilin-type N-terminal cleavage/methylation domain-containing protein
MKKLMPKPRGFTIIEVIIVLVIGAVIMIAVFVVVPQLQQSARNNQRRRDIQRVLVAARQYYTTNTFSDSASGSGSTDGLNIKNLISSNFKDPSLSSNSTTSRDYVIKPRTGNRSGVVTWIEIFYDKKCIASQSTATVNGNLQDSTGSIAVTLDVEPIKPTPYNGNYYGVSHYCIND